MASRTIETMKIVVRRDNGFFEGVECGIEAALSCLKGINRNPILHQREQLTEEICRAPTRSVPAFSRRRSKISAGVHHKQHIIGRPSDANCCVQGYAQFFLDQVSDEKRHPGVEIQEDFIA